MNLDFWARTSGTWINIATVLLGTSLGVLLNGRLPVPMQRIISQSVGLITLFVGFSMAGSLQKAQSGQIDGVILGLMALAIGGILGEWWQLEESLQAIGDWLKRKFRGGGSFTDGFTTASLLFCIGPLALIGSINNGLRGDNTLLTLKAVMDGLAALALTSSFGLGVGCSALVILLYQGGISLTAGILAASLPDPATAPSILLVTGVGGLMILALALNLLEIAEMRVAAFIPALLLAPVIAWLAAWVS